MEANIRPMVRQILLERERLLRIAETRAEKFMAEHRKASSVRRASGAIAGYGVLWVIANGFELVSDQQGLGYGDLKSVAMVGAWLGWTAIPGVIFIGATAAFAVGTAQILTRRASRDTPQPFGPYLVASSLLMVFAGPEINHAYLVATGVA
ncbi:MULTISPECIES: A24 family peptidase [unclassified Salinisphaera]|uniref:prepilin peptidase n=1 Tax=unclassified Salinisphaera TaxID=2649847 RepID=UPI003340791F